MVESPKVPSQDSDQYHGKGWRAKKARVPSQTALTLPTDEAHIAGHDEQVIWSAAAEPEVAEQDATSEQSSSTVYANEAPGTSRSDHLQYHQGMLALMCYVLTMCKDLCPIRAFASV